MLNAFRRIIELSETEDDVWDGIEFLSEIRSDALIDRVLVGLNLTLGEARHKLKMANSELSEKDREERDILVAAFDNMIDFAVAQQFSMMAALEHTETDDIFSEADILEYETVFEKFNLKYAYQENQDVKYSAAVAYWWLSVAGNPLITFVTQRDERVRDSHAILDGESFLKNEFPQELIPPIEFGCRCYLTSENHGVTASTRKSFNEDLEHDPVFAESLAKGGRIFTDKHSYFQIPARSKPKVNEISKNIKSKFYGD